MAFIYNQHGIGDVLLISLKDLAREQRTFARNGNVAKISNNETDEITGYNIFDISQHVKIEGNGIIELTDEQLTTVKRLISDAGFQEILDDALKPKFVVGLVLEKEKHPNADKLSVCKVDVGDEILQIVCGAPNVDANQKVVVAKVGAVMPSGLLIKDAELRGVASSGMICSAKELDLPNAPTEKGILVLSDDYKIGQEFKQ